ncbi:PEP-CTERM sorting domain-containing protein [Phenylobacterium sp.]|uniref:PEP-CTERM sorting domain-containing protein n=1 Tax=Phenylobacterium sp. TaxID=1871053 RepID=UPI002C1CD6A1|nr:PEP-CTERM sorting domain-containing protein [Phenylobacterium sp.]HLZ75020.1 PEP-CTERM sorting domain-containing protein [Phenylobacterium sp.]
MKTLAALGALIFAGFTLAMVTPASATTVATIDGCYDCLSQFDTPVLVIQNSTGGTLNNAKMVLHGYQGVNNGISLTVNLGNLGAGSTQLSWGSLPGVDGSTSAGNLAAYDYDDEYHDPSPYHINDPLCGQPANVGCVDGGGSYWYAQPGNFDVTFTATVSGGLYDTDAVFAVFSPTTNATGHFVGWEGLDQKGFSESPFDVHSGVITGDLANIDLGVPPPPGVPEPAVWGLMLMGFFGAGSMLRRRRATAATA